MAVRDSLASTFQDLVRFLERERTPYLVIGGMAQAVIGEPRLTQDLDCIVALPSSRAVTWLDGFVKAGFEDFVLLKLVPGREKDLLDAKTVLVRHRGHLDRAYLEHWAQRLSDETEDNRMWHTLQRLFTETEAME